MKKDSIILLTAFSGIETFYSVQKTFINLVSKNFKNVYFMNSDYLKLYPEEFAVKRKITKKTIKHLPKNIKLFNPKSFLEVGKFLKNKNPLIINNIGRGFEVYPILFYIKKKNLTKILIGHVGNIQGSTYYWHKANLNIIKYFFTKILPRWISRLMVMLRLFSQIDLRFISNKKIYKGFLKKTNSFIPKYYKQYILVKSKIYDKSLIPKKIEEKYIVHLDQDTDYREMRMVAGSKYDTSLKKKN